MVIRSVNLETVCGITSKIPDNPFNEVAFAGKSNVGKSSMINALLNRKSLARTSAQPGKTQTMSIAIYTAMQGGDREKAYIWVAIVMVISLVVILLMNLWNDRQSRRNGAKKR